MKFHKSRGLGDCQTKLNTDKTLFSQAWKVGQGQKQSMAVGRVCHGRCLYEVSIP